MSYLIGTCDFLIVWSINMVMQERGLTVSASATTEPHLLSSLIDTWLRVALSCCLGMNVLDASPIHSSRNLRKQQQHNELEGLGDQSRTVKQVKDDTAPASGANGLEQVLNLECLEDCQGGLTSSGSSSHSGSSIASDSSTRSATFTEDPIPIHQV